MTPKRTAPAFLTLLESFGEWASWLAIWAIVMLVFFQAFFRYVLDTGLSWPDEVSRYLHIIIVFLCLGSVTRDNRHIRVDFISRRFSARVAEILQLFGLFFTAVVLTAGAAHVMLRIGHLRTPAAGMPIFLFFLPVLLGMSMVVLDCIRKLFAPSRVTPPAVDGPEPSEIT